MPLASNTFSKVVAAARRQRRPWLRVTVGPWWYQVLVLAGARPSTAPDAMHVLATLGATNETNQHIAPCGAAAKELPNKQAERDETFNQVAGAEGQVVMPFYIICDTSGSMSGDMSALNAALAQLHREILEEPVVDDLVELSIIAFDDQAHTVVPLAAPTEITLPELSAGGGTSYSAAFREFYRAFEADRQRLKGEGKKVFRPGIFFLTDGEPNGGDDYLQTFRSLLGYDPVTKNGNPAYPYVTTFGFRDARQDTMQAIAYPNFGEPNKHGRWFIAKQDHQVGQLLKSMTGAIGKSVLKSSQTVRAGTPTYFAPMSVDGMVGSFV